MIIIDNYLSGELLNKIRNDDLWEDNLPSKWLDSYSKPVDVYSLLANKIWYETVNLNTSFAGYEYWTQVVNNRDVPWHQDKDEHHYGLTREVKTPFIGSIYYAHSHPVEGGFLEIERGNDELERIQPVPNRLVIFDSSSFHRVAPTTKGTRRSLLVNIWLQKPMEENFM